MRAGHGVLFEAFTATGIVTAITDADAAVAAFTAAMLANVSFIRVDTPAAICAGASAPLTQGHIGRAGVVGVQHTADEQKRIAQSSFGQRSGDGDGRFTSAQRLIPHVGVGDIIGSTCGIGLEGDDGEAG